MAAFFAKHFKVIAIAIVFLLSFMILVNGCTRPSRIWNWTRTRIFNRGDGNWFDWRNDRRKEEDKEDKDGNADGDEDDSGRRRWNIFRDTGMQDQDSQALEQESEMNDTVMTILVIVGGLAAVWFFVLTPAQREKLNPFRGTAAATTTTAAKAATAAPPVTSDTRAILINAYCILYDTIEDDATRKALTESVLPKVMTANNPPAKKVK